MEGVSAGVPFSIGRTWEVVAGAAFLLKKPIANYYSDVASIFITRRVFCCWETESAVVKI